MNKQVEEEEEGEGEGEEGECDDRVHRSLGNRGRITLDRLSSRHLRIVISNDGDLLYGVRFYVYPIHNL